MLTSCSGRYVVYCVHIMYIFNFDISFALLPAAGGSIYKEYIIFFDSYMHKLYVIPLLL